VVGGEGRRGARAIAARHTRRASASGAGGLRGAPHQPLGFRPGVRCRDLSCSVREHLLGGESLEWSKTELDVISHVWRKKHFATEVDRAERLRKAVADTRRVWPLLLSFGDSLTDAKRAAAAESEKKVAAALRDAGVVA